MKSSLVTKLESLCDRHEEVSALLSDAETASDPNKFRSLSQEYSQLDEVVKVLKKRGSVMKWPCPSVSLYCLIVLFHACVLHTRMYVYAHARALVRAYEGWTRSGAS